MTVYPTTDFDVQKIHQVLEAYVAYRKLTDSASNKNTKYRFFMEFLNCPKEPRYWHESIPELTPDAWHKINWIVGPHAETLYKAWSIRNDR